jgi:hypothetical protein
MFGMNRIYLAFPQWGFTTTYLCITNDLVVEQFVNDINALTIPKFIAWRSYRHFSPQLSDTQLPAFIYTSYTSPGFSRDVRGRVWEGGNCHLILHCNLHFTWVLKKAILIGVDHNFASKGEANKTVVSEGDDQNHFLPNYFGKGVKWQLPDLDTSEVGYTLAREPIAKLDAK